MIGALKDKLATTKQARIDKAKLEADANQLQSEIIALIEDAKCSKVKPNDLLGMETALQSLDQLIIRRENMNEQKTQILREEEEARQQIAEAKEKLGKLSRTQNRIRLQT